MHVPSRFGGCHCSASGCVQRYAHSLFVLTYFLGPCVVVRKYALRAVTESSSCAFIVAVMDGRLPHHRFPMLWVLEAIEVGHRVFRTRSLVVRRKIEVDCCEVRRVQHRAAMLREYSSLQVAAAVVCRLSRVSYAFVVDFGASCAQAGGHQQLY